VNLSAKIFKSLTARVNVSTSICVVSQAAFSLSSSAFRSMKVLMAESRSPGTMPRAMSCSLYTADQDED
jgi:hypothetical protein